MTFTLTLDTRPPASPAVLINGGAALTGGRDVTLELTTADYQGGQHDVASMKLWGDVDPTVDPEVQTTEGASDWQVFQANYAVRLSAGTGRKTIYAKLRDDVLNVTLAFSDFIDLDLTLPVVTITTAVDQSRISKVAPKDTATFVWESSLAFQRYEVRVVPTTGSPHNAGVLIPTTAGSVHTSADGTFPAETGISTTIKGADLEAASPGDTQKIIKVFVRSGGVWSS